MYARRLPELRVLRDQHNPSSNDPQHVQYRAITSSIPVVINFYMVAMQLLRRDLLDVPLFMNTFAKTFLAVIGPLRVVNAETDAVSVAMIDRLNDFQRVCEEWRLREEHAP